MKKVLAAAGTAALAVGIALGVAAPANAGAGYYNGATNIRATGNTTATIHGIGYSGQTATVHCVATQGSLVNGSRWWYRHTNNTTGVSGYSFADGITITNGSGIYLNPSNVC